MGQYDRERKALTLAFGIAVAAAAVAAFAALRSGRGETDVVHARGVQAAEDETRVEPDLVVPEVESVARTSAVVQGDAAAVPVDPERSATTAMGVILTGHTFPTSSSQQVHAWPVTESDDSNSERGGVERVEYVEGTCRDGEWTVTGLTAGPWVFVVHAQFDDRLAYGASKEVHLVDGMENGPFTIILDEFFVQGRVTDSNGIPIPDLAIRFERFSTERRARSGQFATYVVMSGDVVLATGQSEDDIRAALTALLRAQIETDLRIEKPEAVANGLQFLEAVRTTGSADSVRTDTSGNYRIPVEGPGRVKMHAPERNRPIEEGDPWWVNQVVSVELTQVEPSVVRDFMLLRSATFSGRITRADGGPCLGLNVFARRLSGGVSRWVVTVEDGVYMLDVLEPGQYLFYARGGGASGRDLSAHRQVHVSEGDSLRIDLLLQPSRTIVGQVVDGDGNAIANVEVRAYDANNREVVRRGIADAAGHFEIPGVYPIKHEIEVSRWRVRGPVFVDVVPGPGSVDAGTIVIDPVVTDH